MRATAGRGALGLMLLGCCTACAGSAPPPGPEGARALAAGRLGARAEPAPDTGRPAPGAPLGRGAAVARALRRNPDLAARLEELGVGWAEVERASRPENPRLSLSGLLPAAAGGGTLWDLDLGLPLADLVLLPHRRRVSLLAYRALELDAAEAALALATRVEHAWVDAVAAGQRRRVAGLVAELTGASAELARRMRAAGNLDELRVAREEALCAEALVRADRAEALEVEARARLGLLLGGPHGAAEVALPEALPELPAADPDALGLAAGALTRRLDLAAERQHGRALKAARDLVARGAGWLSVELGPGAEREPDGTWRVGPALGAALPLFDRGQADLRRLDAEVRQSAWRAQALEQAIRSDVARVSARLRIQRSIVTRHARVLAPLRERIVALEQQRANWMLTGVDRLLEARREEFDGYDAYVDALAEYWKLRFDLERAAATPLKDAAPAAGASPPAPPDAPPPAAADPPAPGHDH